MSSTQHNRSWLYALLVVAFFLCARAGSVAHAANYGSAPHNHDSKICVFSVLVDEENDDLALPPVELAVSLPSPNFLFSGASVHKAWPVQFIAKTARAPPANNFSLKLL